MATRPTIKKFDHLLETALLVERLLPRLTGVQVMGVLRQQDAVYQRCVTQGLPPAGTALLVALPSFLYRVLPTDAIELDDTLELPQTGLARPVVIDAEQRTAVQE